jgi:hypothetical protein
MSCAGTSSARTKTPVRDCSSRTIRAATPEAFSVIFRSGFTVLDDLAVVVLAATARLPFSHGQDSQNRITAKPARAAVLEAAVLGVDVLGVAALGLTLGGAPADAFEGTFSEVTGTRFGICTK